MKFTEYAFVLQFQVKYSMKNVFIAWWENLCSQNNQEFYKFDYNNAIILSVCFTTVVVSLSPAKLHFRLLSSIALCPRKAQCSYNQICSHRRENMKNSKMA